MKIIIYGDSFTFGVGLQTEYALKMNYIDNYYHDYIKFKNSEKEYSESMNFLVNNRWTTLLEKELNVKIENFGYPGCGWQYIHYNFLLNELNNKDDEQRIYIFCSPRITFRRLLVDKLFENSNLNVTPTYNYSCLNLYYKNQRNKENILLDNLFTKSVTDQLNFHNVLGIINYLILNKKRFIFLPSWLDSVKKSFIFESEEDYSTLYLRNIFFNLSKNNDTKEVIRIINLYDQYIFKYVKDIKMDNFWSNDPNNKLPSGHPNLSVQEKIKNDYLKIINDYNLI